MAARLARHIILLTAAIFVVFGVIVVLADRTRERRGVQQDADRAAPGIGRDVVVALSGLALLAIFAAILPKVVTRVVGEPLTRVRVASRRLAEGETDVPVDLGGDGEIEAIGRELEAIRLRLTRHETLARDGDDDQVDAMRDRFLANMSHEIRTPLTAIIGFADFVEDPALGDERRADALRTIRRNARHLLEIVDDVLDLAKIRAEKMAVESMAVEPVRLLHEVRDTMAPRATARGLDLDVDVASGVPAAVASDPTRLRQILVNLVGNAIKFTRAGGVTLVLRHATEAGASELVFEVRDTGIGMTEDELQRVFEPFTQADDSVSRTHGGTGLGLTISRHLAELLGGTLSAVSRPGCGSTFTLRLPARAPNAPVPVAEHAVTRAGRRGRVLVIDDDADNRILIRMILERLAAEAVVVGDGERGIAAWQEAEREGRPFVAVLMDVNMPEMDGLSCTRRLRALGCHARIVALTAYLGEGDRRRCAEAGCDDFVTKPIAPDRLVALLAPHLEAGDESEVE